VGKFVVNSALEEGRFELPSHLERNSCRRALRAIVGVSI
jgi:hypothetical protein